MTEQEFQAARAGLDAARDQVVEALARPWAEAGDAVMAAFKALYQAGARLAAEVEARDRIMADLLSDRGEDVIRAAERGRVLDLVRRMAAEQDGQRDQMRPASEEWAVRNFAAAVLHRLINTLTKSRPADPLPPDQVRAENERLRQRVAELEKAGLEAVTRWRESNDIAHIGRSMRDLQELVGDPP